MRKWVCLQLLCLVVLAQSALAQEVRGRGSEAIEMGANNGSASIGYWHKLSDANSVGGDFTFYYNDRNRGDNQSYQVSPGIKHYLLPEKSVSPYLYGAIIGRYGNTSSESSNSKARTENYIAGLQGGLGLEWFPVQSVSIAGHVGITAEYQKNRSHSTYTSSYTNFNGLTTTQTSNSTTNDEGFIIGTFSSGILLNLYF